MEVDPKYADGFARLIRQERLDDFDGFLRPVELFDEPPLWSRYDRLTFLDGLPVEEKNRLLIRAAAAHLPRIVEHGRGHHFVCMSTVLGWDEFDEGGLLRPAFWYADPRTRPDPADPRGILDYLRFAPVTSDRGRFVAEALDHDPNLPVTEDEAGVDAAIWRVYVRPAAWP
ncbi:Imm15 family immunity protein (plasmid) [Embleya sp. NBC_00888]|uniref:Imm15 family immunity protein n=1 Tax=Embleya sp. NBC_00888 TaxID=2975960 RepID=UPI00386A5CF3|nr:Imm15 family immunity protein [Embleya sp. NBC_00888]